MLAGRVGSGGQSSGIGSFGAGAAIGAATTAASTATSAGASALAGATQATGGMSALSAAFKTAQMGFASTETNSGGFAFGGVQESNNSAGGGFSSFSEAMGTGAGFTSAPTGAHIQHSSAAKAEDPSHLPMFDGDSVGAGNDDEVLAFVNKKPPQD